MTPEQLERARRVTEEKALIGELVRKVPASVINGGATRAAAYKKAADAAQRAIRAGSNDPGKLRELRLALETAASAPDAQVASIAYAPR